MEVGEKGLYMVGGPTMPPHLYLSLLLSCQESCEEILILRECEATDQGMARDILVVLSSRML
jgi:hypothetical protein